MKKNQRNLGLLILGIVFLLALNFNIRNTLSNDGFRFGFSSLESLASCESAPTGYWGIDGFILCPNGLGGRDWYHCCDFDGSYLPSFCTGIACND